MTEPIDHQTPEDQAPVRAVNRRRMLMTGAGLAGAAVIAKSSSASAADGDVVSVGGEYTAETRTQIDITTGPADIAGDLNAIKGVISNATNGSHAVLGTTTGKGHAVAGVSTNQTVDPGDGKGAKAATWGRHTGPAAGIEGENKATDVDIAGPANGVKGIITEATNGSHAILGITPGDGHAVAGVNTKADNARAATWGRHLGAGAGIEGENKATDIDIAGPANGVNGIITEVTNGSHAIKGVTKGAGHSVAGDTPADAEDGTGGPNKTAATWGRHGGIGAGIGGVSATGYGGEFVGGAASVRLIPSATPPQAAPTEATRKVGELVVDGSGNLWFNTADGANFTKLNDQGGITLLPDPQRAFDSREEELTPANTNKGRFAAQEIRAIDLTEFTDVPVGASGVVVNLTVSDTAPSGYATIFNGGTADADRPNASTINWTDAGTAIANGVIVAVDAEGKVKVFTRVASEVIIDVAGYIG